jgi:23S rRNA (uracil1939-C5)-methyltransferase
MSNASTLVIDRIGSDGDGLARTADGRLVVVPFTLPGERIVDGVAVSASPERVVPACPHFTVCGGCVAQHMGAETYAAWKRGLIVEAFAAQRIDTDVAPLVVSAPQTRRRAQFSIVRTDGAWRLAFHKRRDSAVVAIDTCPVVTPRMDAAIAKLTGLLAVMPGLSETVRVYMADLDGGLEVVVEGASPTLSADQRTRLAAGVAAVNLARLVIGRETIIERAAVSLPGSAGALRPPPGAFFQAVGTAEQAIVEAVMAGLPKKPKRIADLFSGIGTLTLPLARAAAVSAYDSEKPALAALEAAVRHAQGLKPVTSRYRDLIGEPLSVKELSAFDAVVLDPPRSGAKQQCERLAASALKRVVMVSCNPQTLARDARTLVSGGFKLDRVTPIDQFLWSPHIEAVAVFSR